MANKASVLDLPTVYILIQTKLYNIMKKTFITLASVVALAGLAKAQTVTTNSPTNWTLTYSGGTVTPVNTTSQPASWATAVGSDYLSFAADSESPSEAMLIYTYTFTPSFVGAGTATGFFNADNSTTELSLNGVQFASHQNNFTVFDTLSGTAINTIAGVNTLTFSVTNVVNNGNPFNPSGILLDLTFAPVGVPEPSSTALLGLGSLGLLMRRKR